MNTVSPYWLAEGQHFGGLLRLANGLVLLLLTGNNFTGIAAALKVSGNGGKFPIYGFSAPTFRRIPAGGQGGLITATADYNLIEYATVLSLFFTG